MSESLHYYRVDFTVRGTAHAYVQAKSVEDAKEKALELDDEFISLCWQCSESVSGLYLGESIPESVERVVTCEEIEEAASFVEARSV